jgi:hypothetical protein
VGHPVSVVFHEAHPHHPQVSPVVYCSNGGDALFRDLRQILHEDGAAGVSEAALALALRWAAEYGRGAVAMYNLDTPGLPAGAGLTESYPLHLRSVRGKVEADPQWVLVDLAEFRAVSQRGVWDLDHKRPAEPPVAPDPRTEDVGGESAPGSAGG